MSNSPPAADQAPVADLPPAAIVLVIQPVRGAVPTVLTRLPDGGARVSVGSFVWPDLDALERKDLALRLFEAAAFLAADDGAR